MLDLLKRKDSSGHQHKNVSSLNPASRSFSQLLSVRFIACTTCTVGTFRVANIRVGWLVLIFPVFSQT